jgi:hypothetical protein
VTDSIPPKRLLVTISVWRFFSGVNKKAGRRKKKGKATTLNTEGAGKKRIYTDDINSPAQKNVEGKDHVE